MIISNIPYDSLPIMMRDEARAYIENGMLPGSFLLALLLKDWVRMYSKASPVNRQAMAKWAVWVFMIPRMAWGSPVKVAKWCKHGGALGMM